MYYNLKLAYERIIVQIQAKGKGQLGRAYQKIFHAMQGPYSPGPKIVGPLISLIRTTRFLGTAGGDKTWLPERLRYLDGGDVCHKATTVSGR